MTGTHTKNQCSYPAIASQPQQNHYKITNTVAMHALHACHITTSSLALHQRQTTGETTTTTGETTTTNAPWCL